MKCDEDENNDLAELNSTSVNAATYCTLPIKLALLGHISVARHALRRLSAELIAVSSRFGTSCVASLYVLYSTYVQAPSYLAVLRSFPQTAT